MNLPVLANPPPSPNRLQQRLGMLRRRRPLMLWCFATVLLASLVAALLWPATYKSTGVILIEQQEIPSDLVQSTVTSYADQRIQVITQRVMTTENLLKIIDRYDLYSNRRQRETRDAIIARMRKDVDFQMISADIYDPRAGRAAKANIAFSVSYSNGSPQIAAKVANEIASLYLQENLDSRKQSSENAATFLSEESDRINANITELQAKLADFKEQHRDELPDLALINVQVMDRTDESLRDIDTQLRSVEQQITYLQAQLAQLPPVSQMYSSTGERVLSPSDRLQILKMDYARLSALYAPDHPDVVNTRRQIEALGGSTNDNSVDTKASAVNDLRRQLEDAKGQLAEAQKRYAAYHPDVVRLDRLVSSLQASLATAQDDLAQATAAAKAAPDKTLSSGEAKPDNPAYIQVKSQLEAATNQRASLLRERAAVKAKMESYERRLQTAPAVERDYTAITRDLDAAQTKYTEVRQKQMEAQLAEKLESERKGEKFSLIEPPLVPDQPASPNRILIAVLGALLGLALAVGAAVLREAVDSTIRGRAELHELLGVPPLAIVPYLETSAERRRTRWNRRAALAGTAAACVLGVVAIHLFYRPLDVLWAVAMRKLGI